MEIPVQLSTTGLKTRQYSFSNKLEVATRLEVSFMSEMLKSIGTDTEAGGFDGGIGESQFQSFLRERQAEMIVERGGIGLAEHFLSTLTEAKA